MQAKPEKKTNIVLTDEQSKAIKIFNFWRAKKLHRQVNAHASGRLEQINNRLDKLGISVDISANAPIVSNKPIDLAVAERTINRLTSEQHAEFLRLFMRQYIMHITFEKFMHVLNDCCLQLNLWLLNNASSESYTLLYQIGKSQQWVASLALRYLHTLPSKEYKFKLNETPKLNTIASETDWQKQLVFVMFDDNAFSGTQLCEKVISPFFEGFKHYRSTTHSDTDIYLVLVIPFMTSKAMKSVLSTINEEKAVFANTKLHIHIKIITRGLIPLMSQLPLTAVQTKLLVELVDYFGMDRHTEERIQQLLNKPAVYADWKLPDVFSIPTLLWGNVPLHLDKYTGCSLETVPVKVPMLPMANPPYKVSAGGKGMFFISRDNKRQSVQEIVAPRYI